MTFQTSRTVAHRCHRRGESRHLNFITGGRWTKGLVPAAPGPHGVHPSSPEQFPDLRRRWGRRRAGATELLNSARASLGCTLLRPGACRPYSLIPPRLLGMPFGCLARRAGNTGARTVRDVWKVMSVVPVVVPTNSAPRRDRQLQVRGPSPTRWRIAPGATSLGASPVPPRHARGAARGPWNLVHASAKGPLVTMVTTLSPSSGAFRAQNGRRRFPCYEILRVQNKDTPRKPVRPHSPAPRQTRAPACAHLR